MSAYTCGRCTALVDRDERRCPRCGRWFPALFGLRPALDRIFPRHADVTRPLTMALVAIYLLNVLVSLQLKDHDGTLFGRLAPGPDALILFGATHPVFVQGAGQWWRVITANFLHAHLIHILFNASALLQLGRLMERMFGPARFTILFVVGGAVGFTASVLQDNFSIGASAAICAFIGAVFGYGKRRGGTIGADMRSQAIRWIISIALFGLLPMKIDNYAHFGGIAAGIGLGLLFDPRVADRGRESDGARIVALICIAVVIASFAAAMLAAPDVLRMLRPGN